MATATLVGVRNVTLDELRTVPCPAAEGRWRPVPHHEVVGHVSTALTNAGYEIDQLQLGLARADARLFGTAVLKSGLGFGCSVAIGFRSSLDKSISLQWLYGSRVFICGNMAYRSEKVVARKHSTHGLTRFQEAISLAVKDIAGFQEQETDRIRRMIQTDISDHHAEAALLRMYQDEGILSPRTLPVALKEWRQPSYEDFSERKNVWRLYNAVTTSLGPRFDASPQAAAAATIRLGHLLTVDQEVHTASPA